MVSNCILTLVAAAAVASAQSPVYGQCGGQGWTGSTTCASGSTCVYSNAWYSQCLPGSAVTTTKATTTVQPTTTLQTTTRSSSSSPGLPAATGLKRVISFGDSYSQTGFDPTGQLPSGNNVLGNPTLPGYTTSGGKNWLGYLIANYNTSLTYDYNFAYGGATVDSKIVAPYASTVLSLVDQVKQFQNSIASKPSTAPWTSTDSLFAIWMGVNDVGNAWSQMNTAGSTLISQDITQYFNQVQLLYNAGARKFLFLTVPPTYLTPMFAAQGSSAVNGVKTAIANFNQALTSGAATWAAKNSGVNYYLLDTTNAFTTAINNPTAYGAPNANCYNSDGVSCLWWNDYHPGTAIQNLVAKAAAALVGNW